MHFTGNQWRLELKATVSRWRPVLSHRLLPPPPPPRPGNTDPRTVFPRSWWSCPLVNIPWTTETIGHWLDNTVPCHAPRSSFAPTIDFMGSHRGGWKLPEIYIEMFYPPRPVEEVEFHWFNAIQGWYAHAPPLRALAGIFGSIRYQPVFLLGRDRPFQRADRVILLIVYCIFHSQSFMVIRADLLRISSGKNNILVIVWGWDGRSRGKDKKERIVEGRIVSL